jgi:hypothetical protein
MDSRYALCGAVSHSHLAACAPGGGGNQHGQAAADPQPGGVGQQGDIGADHTAAKNAAADAPQSHQSIQALGGAGSDTVVEKSEKGGHHQSAVEVAKQIKAPDTRIIRGVQPLPEQHIAGDKKHGEHKGQLLAPQLSAQAGKNHHRGKSDHHVEDLGQ